MSLFFSAISLVLGLHFFRDNLILCVVLSVIYFIFILVRFSAKKVLLFLSLFVVGALYGGSAHRYDAVDNSYSGVVLSAKENYFIFKSHSERYYVYEKNSTREFGDFVTIKGHPTEFRSTSYESEFDFTEYLSNKGVKRELVVDECEVEFKNPLRIHSLKTKFLSKLDDNGKALCDAFLFNTKDYSNSAINLADQLNLITLLSTTGIYFSFFIRSLKKLYSLKFNDRESHILSLITTSPYVLFSFPKIGIIRVFLTNIIRIPKKDGKKRLLNTQVIGLTALICLAINPYFAFESGFLIGFYIQILIKPCLHFLSITLKNSKRIVGLIMPILVAVILLPFQIFSKGEWHLLLPLFQMLFIPFGEIYSIVAFGGALGIPYYGFINWLSGVLSTIMTAYVKVDLVIPVGVTSIDITVSLFVIGFLVLTYYLESKRYRHAKIVVITLLLGFTSSFSPIQPLVRNAVYFVNVGQGDCIIIQNHFHAVMIDTGGVKNNDLATKCLIPFMHKKQIFKLDALITTHDDFDHCGAAESLKKHFTVKNHLKSDSDFPYSVGDISLKNLNHVEASDENDSSLVLTLNFIGKDFLFMGDASTKVESQIIKENSEIKCDILKVGHHGSKSSTSNEFLQFVKPQEAIISVGKKNSYKHPDDVVLERLQQNNISIRRTDEEGTISYVSILGI